MRNANDLRLSFDAIAELRDRRFGLPIRDDSYIETVRLRFQERSFDRADDPGVVIAKHASAEQREVDDVDAGA